MQLYSSILGIPVICSNSAKQIGNVKDVIFNSNKKKVLCFLIECKKYINKNKLVYFDDILNLGNDALIIKNRSLLKDKKDLDNCLPSNNSIIDMKVYSKSGNNVGIVKDIMIDTKNAYIDGLIISNGLIRDIMMGRSALPIFGKTEFGKDTILIDEAIVEEILENEKGLKKLWK